MTLVKICGITRAEDAALAVKLGAQALGFNFYSKSKRYIEPAKARQIIQSLPDSIWLTGVFVNHSRDEIERIVQEAGLNTIQLHGDELPELCSGWKGLRVIKALRIGAGAPDYNVAAYAGRSDFLLLDRFDSAEFGGMGKTVDDSLLAAFVGRFDKILLSGGIMPENAAEKIARYKPFGIDVASGVESAPGVKDEKKMRKLMEIKKGTDTAYRI